MPWLLIGQIAAAVDIAVVSVVAAATVIDYGNFPPCKNHLHLHPWKMSNLQLLLPNTGCTVCQQLPTTVTDGFSACGPFVFAQLRSEIHRKLMCQMLRHRRYMYSDGKI